VTRRALDIVEGLTNVADMRDARLKTAWHEDPKIIGPYTSTHCTTSFSSRDVTKQPYAAANRS